MSLERHPQDDAELWAEWSQQHGRAVWGYIWGMVRRHDLADDLTQEVFCRAWQARAGYEERGTGRAYLLRIADRLVWDQHRKAGREINLNEDTWELVEPTETLETADEIAGKGEAFAQLATALDRLSPRQRRVLLLRFYGELPFAEIASMMNCPIGTVLSHCHRGLAALRNLLVETDT